MVDEEKNDCQLLREAHGSSASTLRIISIWLSKADTSPTPLDKSTPRPHYAFIQSFCLVCGLRRMRRVVWFRSQSEMFNRIKAVSDAITKPSLSERVWNINSVSGQARHPGTAEALSAEQMCDWWRQGAWCGRKWELAALMVALFHLAALFVTL